MHITWLGTASFLMETEKGRILFDPFVQLIGGTNPNTIDDFLNEDVIFITHAHFDHLIYVPEILERSEATVFCGSVAAEKLEELTEETGRIAKITTGQTIPIGDIKVTAFHGRHIYFDKKLIGETLSPKRMLRYARNLPFLAYANHSFQEKSQTYTYLIEAEGKRILLLGSMNLDPKEIYPKDIDVLVLPYQGNSDLPREAHKVIDALRPRQVLLSHFDNAFPPVSRDVPLHPLKEMMERFFPDIRLIRPVRGKQMTL